MTILLTPPFINLLSPIVHNLPIPVLNSLIETCPNWINVFAFMLVMWIVIDVSTSSQFINPSLSMCREMFISSKFWSWDAECEAASWRSSMRFDLSSQGSMGTCECNGPSLWAFKHPRMSYSLPWSLSRFCIVGCCWWGSCGGWLFCGFSGCNKLFIKRPVAMIAFCCWYCCGCCGRFRWVAAWSVTNCLTRG